MLAPRARVLRDEGSPLGRDPQGLLELTLHPAVDDDAPDDAAISVARRKDGACASRTGQRPCRGISPGAVSPPAHRRADPSGRRRRVLARLLEAQFYQTLPGSLLEGMGKLFANNVKFYAYPMPRDAVIAAVWCRPARSLGWWTAPQRCASRLVRCTDPRRRPAARAAGQSPLSLPARIRRCHTNRAGSRVTAAPLRDSAGGFRHSHPILNLISLLRRSYDASQVIPDLRSIEVVAVLFLATFIRSAFGFGKALVAVPLLAMIMPVEAAAPIAVLVSITVAAVVLVQDWRKVHLRSAGWLIASTLVGTPLGLLLLTHVNARIVKRILGSVIIIFSAYSLMRGISCASRMIASPGYSDLSRGFLAAYGMNGPPLVIYGGLRRWSPQHSRHLAGLFPSREHRKPLGLLVQRPLDAGGDTRLPAVDSSSDHRDLSGPIRKPSNEGSFISSLDPRRSGCGGRGAVAAGGVTSFASGVSRSSVLVIPICHVRLRGISFITNDGDNAMNDRQISCTSTHSRCLTAMLIVFLTGCGPTHTAGTSGMAAKDLAVLSVAQLPKEAHVQIHTIQFDGAGQEYEIGKSHDFYLLPSEHTASFTLHCQGPRYGRWHRRRDWGDWKLIHAQRRTDSTWPDECSAWRDDRRQDLRVRAASGLQPDAPERPVVAGAGKGVHQQVVKRCPST